MANEAPLSTEHSVASCTCPSGDGSLRWPCPVHPPSMHTRGPWETEAVFSNRRYDIVLGYKIEGAGHPILVATVYADDDEGDDPKVPGHISAEEAEATASLIAAAPELLAGAKAILAARDSKASINAVIALRDAIAKAEGRNRG